MSEGVYGMLQDAGAAFVCSLSYKESRTEAKPSRNHNHG